MPLTEATNPVKVYEMLATGKPVVAVGLPELVPIAADGLIRLGDTAEQFAGAIEAELQGGEPSLPDRRRAFARENTWQARIGTWRSRSTGSSVGVARPIGGLTISSPREKGTGSESSRCLSPFLEGLPRSDSKGCAA